MHNEGYKPSKFQLDGLAIATSKWGFQKLVFAVAVVVESVHISLPYGVGPALYMGLLITTYFALLYKQPQDDLLRPTPIFLSIFVIYTFSGYMNVLQMDPGVFSTKTEITFQASSLLEMIAVHFGSHLGSLAVDRTSWRRKRPQPVDKRKFLILSLGFLAIIAYPARTAFQQLFSLSKTASYVEWSLSRRVDTMQDPYAMVTWLWSDLAYYFLIVIFLVPFFTRTKYKHLGLAVAALISILTLREGLKNYAIFFGTAILVFVNYQKKRVRYPLLLACTIPAVLGITIFNSVRDTTSLSKMASRANDLVSSDAKYILPTQMGEFSGLVHEYLLLLDGMESNVTDISYGATALRDMGSYIPRFVWRERPEQSSFLFMQLFHARAFQKGAGTGFYIVAEGYWALGFLGVFIEGALYGYFLAWWYGSVAKPWTDPIRALVYAWALQIVVVPVVRSGFILTPKIALMYVGPVWAILWLSTPVGRSVIAKRVKTLEPDERRTFATTRIAINQQQGSRG